MEQTKTKKTSITLTGKALDDLKKITKSGRRGRTGAKQVSINCNALSDYIGTLDVSGDAVTLEIEPTTDQISPQAEFKVLYVEPIQQKKTQKKRSTIKSTKTDKTRPSKITASGKPEESNRPKEKKTTASKGKNKERELLQVPGHGETSTIDR